jgi:ribose transport system permease protein
MMFRRFFADYGIIVVLLLLCIFYSFATLKEQYPTGKDAAAQVVKAALSAHGKDGRYIVAIGTGDEQAAYADAVVSALQAASVQAVELVKGGPPNVRQGLEQIAQTQPKVAAVIVSKEEANWPFIAEIDTKIPALAGVAKFQPKPYLYPDFLKKSNVLAIADRIVVIAIIAIGMTMVIITTGFDLSVGSLIAISAVVWTMLIRDYAGAEQAGALGMILAALGAIAVCVSGYSQD